MAWPAGQGVVSALALGADGARLVTSSAGGATRVWDLAAPPPNAATLPQDPSKLAELACSAAGRNLTAEEWQQYFDGTPYRRTCDR